MAPFSAPFSGFCPQLRSLCKGRDDGWCSPVSGRRPFPFCHPPSRAMAMVDGRFCLPDGLIPADDADASARPAPLCAAQARPARRSGHEAEGSVRRPPLPPCRRRETIFRRPLGRRPTSVPRQKRRPRLATTPRGVSVAGWGIVGMSEGGGENAGAGFRAIGVHGMGETSAAACVYTQLFSRHTGRYAGARGAAFAARKGGRQRVG